MIFWLSMGDINEIIKSEKLTIRRGNAKMAGKIYGIGVGPGDPELLTIKAVRIIQECDIIGIPAKDIASCTAYQIAKKAVPEIEEKPVVAVRVPMTTDAERLCAAYDQGCADLIEMLNKNKKIAFLNLGDPTIYASYMEIHNRIVKAGFEAELVSGVPSFCAVAAALGVSLGSGKESIHILPGRNTGGEWEVYKGTRILMKSGGQIGEIKERLVELEQENQISAFAVTNCGMKNQMVCRNIRELEEQAGYFTTVIVKENRQKQ